MFSKTKRNASKNVGIQKVNELKRKAQYAYFLLFTTIAAPVSVFAGSGGGDANGTIKDVLDIVTLVFPLIGMPLALVGAFKIFMAYRGGGQDGDMGAAAKDLAIGIVMVLFRSLVWPPLADAIIK